MTTNQEFGREALARAEDIVRLSTTGPIILNTYYLKGLVRYIEQMQTQHREALGKAAGEWILCSDELPNSSGYYDIQFCDETVECIEFKPNGKWRSMHDIVRWFKPAEPPAPPPLPEPEIEVPDLEPSGAEVYDIYKQYNEAHKAAMLPVLLEFADVRARLEQTERDYAHMYEMERAASARLRAAHHKIEELEDKLKDLSND